MLFLTSVYSQTSCAADLGWKLVLKHTNLSTYLPWSLGERQGTGRFVVGGSEF